MDSNSVKIDRIRLKISFKICVRNSSPGIKILTKGASAVKRRFATLLP